MRANDGLHEAWVGPPIAIASGLINLSKLLRLSGRPGDLDRLGAVFTRALQGDDDVLLVKHYAGNVVVDQISWGEAGVDGAAQGGSRTEVYSIFI